MSDEGLICGARSVLARMAGGDGPGNTRLALDTDGPRLFAMLSIAFRRPVSPDILVPIEAAASHWSRGDKALANLRLIFADLPKLREPSDAYRMYLAEHLLDEGMAPGALMKALGLESGVDLSRNYDPYEPRVPAGSGRRSGEWDFGGRSALAGTSADRIVVAIEDDPTEDKKNLEDPARHQGAGQLPEDEHGFQLNPLPGLPLPGGRPIPPVGGSAPPLQRIHPDTTYEGGTAKNSLDYIRNQSTEEILRSLAPGAEKPLRVKPDGRIFDGNTRVKVLQERGYDTETLPRSKP